jgi:hypothetical protein
MYSFALSFVAGIRRGLSVGGPACPDEATPFHPPFKQS